MLFHIFAHVVAQELHAHEFGQTAGHFGFAHTCGPVEQKGPGRALLLSESGAGAQNGPDNEFDGFLLAKDQMLQIPFKTGQTHAFPP